jgi:hypothetical protein
MGLLDLKTPTKRQAGLEFFSDHDRRGQPAVEMRWPDAVVTCSTCNNTESV